MTFQYPINRLILSHSARSSFRRCPRILEFTKMYGDSSDREETYPAECGKAIHAGFQHYLIHKDLDKALMEFMTNSPHDLEFADPKNQARSMEACYITLETMINSHFLDEWELVKIRTQLPGNPEKWAVEVPFVIEIIGAPLPIPVYFVGLIDDVLYNRHEKTYVANDIKSTRINVLDMSVKYQFDEQTVPYGIVLEHILGHEVEEFDTTYLSAYIDLSDPKCSMYKFTKTKEHIHDWYRGLCGDIRRIGDYYKGQWFPRSTTGDSCFAFNKPCFFASECTERDPQILRRLVGGNNRQGFFHDGKVQPWVTIKIPYQEF